MNTFNAQTSQATRFGKFWNKGTESNYHYVETVGIRVPALNMRTITTFSCIYNHYPSARRAFAANAVCKSTDILDTNM
jgi:hypothetical protein